MLRIAFAGTPQFALPTLAALSSSEHLLVGVLTQPDRPAGRGRALHASPVKQYALRLGVPIAQPAELKTAAGHAPLLAWAPELIIVVAYGLILPPAVLSMPRLGCINVHASLLPRWRGAAPIERAILAGDPATGISIMQMEVGLDTGPVFSSATVPIGARGTAAQLHEALASLGARLLVSTLAELERGAARPKPQSAEGVSYAPKIARGEARIDWRSSALSIDRQIRALNPWPIAETLWRGVQLRIWEAIPMDGAPVRSASGEPIQGVVPGTVLALDAEGIQVACGAGRLALRGVQLAGRRVISAREFAHAAHPLGALLGV